MFNFDFSVHALWWTPLVSSVWLRDNNGFTEKCQNRKYCGNKDTYILDALEVSKNISKINFKVNYPFNTISCSTGEVIYRTKFRKATCRSNRHIFYISSLYRFLSLLIFFFLFLSSTPFFLHSLAALSAVEGTNCICRSPCNMTRYNKELSMVKIPSKTSARYLEKKFNRSEKYITWVCTSQPFKKPLSFTSKWLWIQHPKVSEVFFFFFCNFTT